MHQLEDLIATRLQRNVEMWHEAARLRNIFYYLIGYKIRLYRRYPVSRHAFDTVKSLHQRDKTLACGFSEITYIDTCYHYLLATFGNSLLRLLHKLAHQRVAATSTCKGNGAVCTEIVTTVLHLEKIACTVAT